MKRLFLLAIVTVAPGFFGCAQATQHYITDRANSVRTAFDVRLEKPFVSSVSSISGGQAAMILLVGPFTNNGVLLIGKEVSATGEKVAFRERLKWGKNSFEVLLNRNTTYQLVAVVQGTRSGSKDLGTIQVGAGGDQHFTVNLLEDEVSVK